MIALVSGRYCLNSCESDCTVEHGQHARVLYRAVCAQHQDVQLLHSDRAVGLQLAGLSRTLGEMCREDIPENGCLIHPALLLRG